MTTEEIVRIVRNHGYGAEAASDGRIIVSLASRRPSRAEVQGVLEPEGIAVNSRFIIVKRPS